MRVFIQRVSGALAVLAVAGTTGAAAPAPCVLKAPGLEIEVRSEPDDGVWGPTVEVVIRDELQPLSRLMAPEPRPIEACWWTNIDTDAQMELVIGVGTYQRLAAGALIYEWDGHAFHGTPLPALPPAAVGTFRYVARGNRLWAYPVTGAMPAQAYRLEATGWTRQPSP